MAAIDVNMGCPKEYSTKVSPLHAARLCGVQTPFGCPTEPHLIFNLCKHCKCLTEIFLHLIIFFHGATETSNAYLARVDK